MTVSTLRGVRKRSPTAMDHLRAKALKGDPLAQLTDREREWVWRSLLKGVRRAETQALADLDDAQLQKALARVKRWYQARIDQYKAVHVVRPVVPVAPRRRRWWPFGKGGR
jgi:hypothetical protein